MGRIIIFTREINGWEMLRPAKDSPCEGVVQAAQGMRDRVLEQREAVSWA